MHKWLLVPSLTLLLAAMARPALAEDRPSWDPSVGYNPQVLDEAIAKARQEAEKKGGERAFAPQATTPGKPDQPAVQARDPLDPRGTASVGH